MVRFFLIGAELWSDRVNTSIYFLPGSDFHFYLLVFGTLLISAAGYIINDYFDIKIDRINKPKKLIVSKYIKKRWAMLIHVVFNSIAILIGLYLSWIYFNLYIISVFLLTTTILWWYSLSLKRKLLSGNIAISILAASVVLLVGWFELPIIEKQYSGSPAGQPFSASSMVTIKWMVLGYAFFAGFTTLIREIIKDLADMEGDAAVNCKTLPLSIGISATKKIILSMIFLFLLFLSVLIYFYLNNSFTLMYFSALVALPLLTSAIVSFTSNSRKGFLLAGNLIKVAMFTGVLYLYFIKDYAS